MLACRCGKHNQVTPWNKRLLFSSSHELGLSQNWLIFGLRVALLQSMEQARYLEQCCRMCYPYYTNLQIWITKTNSLIKPRINLCLANCILRSRRVSMCDDPQQKSKTKRKTQQWHWISRERTLRVWLGTAHFKLLRLRTDCGRRWYLIPAQRKRKNNYE